MPLSEYAADLLATAEANGTAYQGPATIYLALMTVASTPDTTGTEVTGDGYARVAFAQTGWTNDGAGELSNTAEIAWEEAEEDWGTAVEVATFDASTAGNRLWSEDLTDDVIIANGQTFVIDAGSLVRQAV